MVSLAAKQSREGAACLDYLVPSHGLTGVRPTHVITSNVQIHPERPPAKPMLSIPQQSCHGCAIPCHRCEGTYSPRKPSMRLYNNDSTAGGVHRK